MKKLICAFICLLLVVPSALADTPAKMLTEDDPLYTSLYERSMELAWLFNEALHSDDYVGMIVPLDAVENTLNLLRMQDFTKPLDVKTVRSDRLVDDGVFNRLLNILPGADFHEGLKETVRRKFYQTCALQLSAMEGEETMLLSTALTLSDAYMLPEGMDMPCFVVMYYGGLYAYLVTFYPTVNGTMVANAQFIPSFAADELNFPGEE